MMKKRVRKKMVRKRTLEMKMMERERRKVRIEENSDDQLITEK